MLQLPLLNGESLASGKSDCPCLQSSRYHITPFKIRLPLATMDCFGHFEGSSDYHLVPSILARVWGRPLFLSLEGSWHPGHDDEVSWHKKKMVPWKYIISIIEVNAERFDIFKFLPMVQDHPSW
ncbi:hypothetical protein CEXT_148331 [Caerostris extrusa]|uniref:Uncharacterized protein n=1 Tax=Caerostris extrusa TaxID=172846 RepID=A0AAV4TYY8_CAEEX|nr:hypothetical protein CEXT_148331 [Caerostris extrusa]